ANGTYEYAADQFAAQQDQIDQGKAELQDQLEQLTFGEQMLELTEDVRQVSEDGSAAVIAVTFDEPTYEVSQETKDTLMDLFRSNPIDGVQVDFSAEIATGVPQILGAGELVGVVVAAIVLLIMLGSLVAAGLPVINALFGVAVAALGSLAFSSLVDMVSVTPILGIMLGLAVGIDYSLFILHRHRRQLKEGHELTESIGLANGTSGSAVVFAGITVVIALLALNVTGIGFLGMMGRSEEHTSELQSRFDLVCRLLREKKTVVQHSSPQRTVLGPLGLMANALRLAEAIRDQLEVADPRPDSRGAIVHADGDADVATVGQ